MSECVLDLERYGHLVRIREEVDPNLEMAAIHRRVFQAGGPAVFYENVAGSKFKAVSNLFGSIERSKFLFRETLEKVQKLVALRNDPTQAIRRPWRYGKVLLTAFSALPKKARNNSVLHGETNIDQLPQVKCWPDDGGAFIRL